jgi:predicted ATP-grasp superfamily ATP-dependent carboligase
MNKGVLITDGENRIALSILRSLARRNIETAITVEGQTALSSFSRYCNNRILCPSSSRDISGFIATLRKLAKKNTFDFLFPATDTSLIAVSKYRDTLGSSVTRSLPSHESVEKAFDKSLTLIAADEEGIPTPRTFIVRNIAQLKDAARKVAYPAVIKPRWSWVWNRSKASYSRGSYINSASELLSSYKAIHENFPFPLVQEYVPGKNFSVAVIADHCEPKVACCIMVHRTSPVTGGNSVLRETVQPNPEMTKYAFKLLKNLKWHGVAEVEFKMDARDQTPKLMEVNGRFWASLQVAIDSGIDFPYLQYQLITNGKIKPAFSYKIGVKGRWLLGDIDNLLSVLKGKPRVKTLRVSRLRTILNFMKFYERGMHYDNFSADDPMPFFMNIRSIKHWRR